MATESELIDLLDAIGDRAPTVRNTLDRLALPTPAPTRTRSRLLPITAAVAAVAATVVVSVALRGDHPHGAPTTDPAAAGATADHATYPLPLDPYYADAQQERTLRRAQFVLAQRCAQGRGVTVPDAQFPASDPRPTFIASVAHNIRPLTLDQARSIGYDMYPAGHSAVDAATRGLNSQQLAVFQGCFDDAAQTLLKGATPVASPGDSYVNGKPGVFEDDMTVSNVYVDAAQWGDTAPVVEQAQTRWAGCMAANGYAGLDTTTALIESMGDLRSAAAKREAVQDVRCKQSTGFLTVWVASMTRAQNSVIAAHRTDLAGFKARLATRMANAERALR